MPPDPIEPLAPVSWPAFLDSWRWRQGEHVTLLGPTGAGKTTLMHAILPRRDYVAVFATKRRDTSMQKLIRAGYSIARTWPANSPRVVLWPKLDRVDAQANQADVFADAINGIFQSGGWCAALDEVSYLVTDLGLERSVKLLWQQGRAIGVSVVAASQRPRHVPLAAYSQATHLFLWQNNDDSDLKRLSEIGGRVDQKRLRYLVKHLDGHEVLYVNARDGTLALTKVT